MSTVEVGQPITTHQAVMGLLRMIETPILGHVDLDSGPRHTFGRIYGDHGIYQMLSGGERKLADIAYSLWKGPDPAGAHISAIGGLDRTLRRKVLLVLLYFYLGRDVRVEASVDEFDGLFVGERRS